LKFLKVCNEISNQKQIEPKVELSNVQESFFDRFFKNSAIFFIFFHRFL
jgi:hypothetical protein